MTTTLRADDTRVPVFNPHGRFGTVTKIIDTATGPQYAVVVDGDPAAGGAWGFKGSEIELVPRLPMLDYPDKHADG